MDRALKNTVTQKAFTRMSEYVISFIILTDSWDLFSDIKLLFLHFFVCLFLLDYFHLSFFYFDSSYLFSLFHFPFLFYPVQFDPSLFQFNSI